MGKKLAVALVLLSVVSAMIAMVCVVISLSLYNQNLQMANALEEKTAEIQKQTEAYKRLQRYSNNLSEELAALQTVKVAYKGDIDELPVAADEYYKVRMGDSLSKIAHSYYKQASLYKPLAGLNRVFGPDFKIRVGEILLVPNKEFLLNWADREATRTREKENEKPIAGAEPLPPRFFGNLFGAHQVPWDQDFYQPAQLESIPEPIPPVLCEKIVIAAAQFPRLVTALGLEQTRLLLAGSPEETYGEVLAKQEETLLQNKKIEQKGRISESLELYSTLVDMKEMSTEDKRPKVSTRAIEAVLGLPDCPVIDASALSDEMKVAITKLYYFDLVRQHGPFEATHSILDEYREIK